MSHKVKEIPEGEFGIFMSDGTSTVSQIGLTEEQRVIFQLFLKMMSGEKGLVKLPEEYDLTLKSNCWQAPVG